jgi:hypothetical protein
MENVGSYKIKMAELLKDDAFGEFGFFIRGVSNMRGSIIRKCSLSLVLVIILAGLFSIIPSCGGGGGGGSSDLAPPFIGAELDSFPTGSVPPGLIPSGFNSMAFVYVIDVNSGVPITDAAVTMNGMSLMYSNADQDYEGNIVVNPGGSVTLNVAVRGKTYTVSDNQFTSYPIISSPTAGTTWSGGNYNTVTWSATANGQFREFYGLGVLDATDPSNLIWPEDNFVREVPIGTSIYGIPANSLTSGSRHVIVGITSVVPISSAAVGSAIYISGYNYVQINVDNWGSHWTAQTSGTTAPLTGVAWSGTTFVAAGLSGFNGIVLTSSDGIAWTSQDVGTAGSLFDVIWSGTQFIAVGDGGVIISSPDGLTWTSRTSGTGSTLYGIAWSGTQFVAVGQGGTSAIILTSPDGITWTSRTSGISSDLYGITWSGTQFVAVGTGTILTSPDGITWTSRTVGTIYGLYGVVWSGKQFVVVGEMGRIFTSPDGITWTPQTSGASSILNSVIWTGTHFIAVGYGGEIFTSSDGVTWLPQTSGTIEFLYGVTWSGTQLVIVGGGGTILTSP